MGLSSVLFLSSLLFLFSSQQTTLRMHDEFQRLPYSSNLLIVSIWRKESCVRSDMHICKQSTISTTSQSWQDVYSLLELKSGIGCCKISRCCKRYERWKGAACIPFNLILSLVYNKICKQLMLPPGGCSFIDMIDYKINCWTQERTSPTLT